MIKFLTLVYSHVVLHIQSSFLHENQYFCLGASIAVTDCPLSNGSDYRLDANCSNVITTHDQAHEQWLRVDNNYTEIESTGTFNLTQPSDQSKFLRFVNNSLVQIVYTMIEGKPFLISQRWLESN